MHARLGWKNAIRVGERQNTFMTAYSEKAKRARISNPEAWTSKARYLNLPKDPDAFDEDCHSGRFDSLPTQVGSP